MTWRKSSYSESGNCVEARWVKSSHSQMNGHCVEVGFRRSSHSNGGNCVEARAGEGAVQVRDSKDPGPVLELTEEAWRAFLDRLALKDTPRRWHLLDPPMC